MATASWRQSLIRSFAVILSSLMLGVFLLKTPWLMIAGILFALGINLLVIHYGHMRSFIHTLIVSLITCYCFAIVRTIITLVHEGKPILENINKIFIASGVLSLVTFGLFIPSWLIFWFIDSMIVKSSPQKPL